MASLHPCRGAFKRTATFSVALLVTACPALIDRCAFSPCCSVILFSSCFYAAAASQASSSLEGWKTAGSGVLAAPALSGGHLRVLYTCSFEALSYSEYFPKEPDSAFVPLIGTSPDCVIPRTHPKDGSQVLQFER